MVVEFGYYVIVLFGWIRICVGRCYMWIIVRFCYFMVCKWLLFYWILLSIKIKL